MKTAVKTRVLSPELSNTECKHPWRMRSGGYDVAQVCLNGHVINARSESSPEDNTKYCADCGERTITSCQDCGEKIRGESTAPAFFATGYTDPAPSYCIECGKPYPWTQSKIEAFRELVGVLSLNQDNKTVLLDGITHITRDTPRTEVVCAKFSRIISKLKPQEPRLISILSNIATDRAKELLVEAIGAPPA